MTNRTTEDQDLALVEELIAGPSGIVLKRIEAAPSEPRPDFELISWRGFAGYCEVKSPRDDWLEDQLEKVPPGTIVGGARPDPTFNRIARHILKAVTQFDAVNPDHAVPNVLVLVNHDDNSGFGDLSETLRGKFEADTGETYDTVKHISHGILGEKRKRIDLYVWIDAYGEHKRVAGWFLTDEVPAHTEALKTLFVNLLPKKGGG